MKRTITNNPMKSFMDKYIFDTHQFKNIHHRKWPDGSIRVFDGLKLVEVLAPEKTKQVREVRWIPTF